MEQPFGSVEGRFLCLPHRSQEVASQRPSRAWGGNIFGGWRNPRSSQRAVGLVIKVLAACGHLDPSLRPLSTTSYVQCAPDFWLAVLCASERRGWEQEKVKWKVLQLFPANRQHLEKQNGGFLALCASRLEEKIVPYQVRPSRLAVAQQEPSDQYWICASLWPAAASGILFSRAKAMMYFPLSQWFSNCGS